MGFEKGKPRHPDAGRRAGTKNKRTEEAQALCERLGVDPLEILLLMAKGDWKALGYEDKQKLIPIGDGQTLLVDRIDEQLRQKAAKDALPYVRPQLKSVELTGEAAQNAVASITQAMALAAMLQKDKNAGSNAAGPQPGPADKGAGN